MPDDMKRRYEDMVQAGVTIPSLSHYVRYQELSILCREGR